MTSATEVLRRLLDERGVEHEDDEDVTRFFGPDGFEVVMQEDIDGKLDCLTPLYLTPEQAIAATLGSCNCSNNYTNSERTGTCEADETDRIECVETVGGRHYDIHIMECTECGHTYEHVNGDYEYCPRCGRKRRDVEE